MNERKPNLLFYVLIFAITVAFAVVVLLDRTNAQEIENLGLIENDMLIDVNDLSATLKPLVSSTKIIYTKNGYARTPDMLTPQYDYLFSEIDRYQTAYHKCAGI